MSTILSRLNNRVRQLVAFLRRTRLRDGASRIDRSSREVRSSSVDFRSARPGSHPEFQQMAERYGVDVALAPLDLHGAVRDAERICLECQDVRRCRRWLTRETIDDPRLFCANAPLFRMIAAKGASQIPLRDGGPAQPSGSA